MKPEVEAEVLARFAAPRSEQPPAPTGPEPRGLDYTDPARSDRERANVFARSWVPLARTCELREAGDCRTLDLAGEPLVALRDEHGTLRVLRNVCLHRGAQIVRQAPTRIRSLRCPYHVFDYGLDGTLRVCPVSQNFAVQSQGGAAALRMIRSADYGGWLWACLEGHAPDLEVSLGPELVDELEHYPLADLELLAVRELEGTFDWKVGVDAFLEPLHVPSIHARSAHPLVDFRGLAVRALGEHSRMALPFRVPDAYAPNGVLGTAAHVAGVVNFPRLNRVQREAHLVYHAFPSLGPLALSGYEARIAHFHQALARRLAD